MHWSCQSQGSIRKKVERWVEPKNKDIKQGGTARNRPWLERVLGDFLLNKFMEIENQNNQNNKLKANCDVEISHKITRDIDMNLVDSFILISGDGDFVPLFDFAKSFNLIAKVIAFDPKSCARMIKQRFFLKVSYIVDDYHFYKDDNKMLFENEKPPTST